jgi:hypothetical protein
MSCLSPTNCPDVETGMPCNACAAPALAATHTARCRTCGAPVRGTNPVGRGGATGPGLTAPAHPCATPTGFVRSDAEPEAIR